MSTHRPKYCVGYKLRTYTKKKPTNLLLMKIFETNAQIHNFGEMSEK